MRKLLTVLFAITAICCFAIYGVRAWNYYFPPVSESGVATDIVLAENECEEELIPVLPLPEQAKDEALSENLIGWIRFDGLDIDDPLLQCGDNKFYLKHNQYDMYDPWGAYFLHRGNSCDSKSLDKVSIIFGHSLEGITDKMFSKLKLLRQEEYAKTCRYVDLWLGEDYTRWEVFAAAEYPIELDYIIPNPTDEYQSGQLQEMISRSYFQYETQVDSLDNILILSTCTSRENYRFIVALKLCQS